MNKNNSSYRLLLTSLTLVLVVGIATPAFAQLSSGGTPTPGPGATASIAETATAVCVVLDFEGVGDNVPVGTIGDVSFSANGLGLVDSDAGGTGNFANEPSPDTIMYDPVGNVITATLANPVNEISWNYATNSPGEIRVFGAGNVLLSTIPLPAIPQVDPGDPTGSAFGTWDSGIHTEVGNVITSVEYDGGANVMAWDDLDYCEFTVGGSTMSIDTTALILAGAQTNAVWLMSALAVIGSVAFGALYITSKKN